MFRKTHHHFLLRYNPWPLIVRICSFNLVFSVLLLFKFRLTQPLLLSFSFISFLSLTWWIFYSKELNLEGKESLGLEEGIKFSMILFISSEVFFFFSFFWSYFHFFLSPLVETSLHWPPLQVEMFDASDVPLINTLVLMSSGVTVTLSHYFLVENYKKSYLVFLFFTIVLGIFFTYLQWIEYNNSFFSLRDSTFGTSFFMLTGFHGIHVIIGTMFLSIVFLRSFFFSSCAEESIRFELASWYWHFVDVVWLFLYFCLYYLNN